MKSLFVTFFLLWAVTRSFTQPPKPLNELHNDLLVHKDTAYVNTLQHIAMTHKSVNDLDSAAWYFAKMEAEADKIEYKVGKYGAIVGMGDTYLMRGNYDSAKKNDNFEAALEYYMKALKMFDYPELKSKNPSKIYARIGQLYTSQNEIDLALKYLKDAEKSLAATTDTLGILDINHALITCYRRKMDTTETYRLLNKGLLILDLFEQTKATTPQMKKYINKLRLVHINNALDENESNASINDRCLAILEKIQADKDALPDDPLLKCAVASNIATLYMFKGNYVKSIGFSKQALEQYPDIHIYKHSLYKNLARSYYATGEYKLAYDFYNLYNQQYEERYQKEKFASLAELQTKYETERKEQQIDTLNKEKKSQRTMIGISIAALIVAIGLLLFVLRANRLQKKLFAREKELQKSEMEKRMFELEQTALRAQMNPHFIFNSLNSVQRFVINNDAEGVNHYLSTFANLIRQTLENSGKQLIPLKDEVRYLDTYLRLEQMRGNEKFRYNINVNPDVDPEETYIPNMIIQPYLENSVIHGMAGKKEKEGVINLTISRNHKLTCVVEDNGMGINASKVYKTADAEHESLGTAITEKRIEMFNTVSQEKIELQVMDKSEMGGNESGTRIMIKFPINSSN